MARWGRLSTVAGIAAGTAAAGAGTLLVLERIAVGRIRLRPDPEAGEPLGQLRGRPLTVLADDGVPLQAEISGRDDAPASIVFCHGYTLNQESWYYQRRDLADAARLVFWDHRSHGRSGRSDPAHVSISQLASDLRAVLLAAAPGDHPVVLAGHSMGGMTIMGLARRYPELFGTKVVAVALISTVAAAVDPAAWLPPPLRPLLRTAAPALLRGAAAGRGAALLERSRQAAGDLAFLATRYLGFGDPGISPAVVDFLDRIIRATPVEVVAQFYQALLDHDESAALAVLGRVPVVVLAGEADRLIPPGQPDALAAAIPGAELIRVPGAGHVIILERPDLVRDALEGLLAAAAAAGGAQGETA